MIIKGCYNGNGKFEKYAWNRELLRKIHMSTCTAAHPRAYIGTNWIWGLLMTKKP